MKNSINNTTTTSIVILSIVLRGNSVEKSLINKYIFQKLNVNKTWKISACLFDPIAKINPRETRFFDLANISLREN